MTKIMMNMVMSVSKVKSRGNGQGSAYRSENGRSWVAQAVVGYRVPTKPGGQPIPIKRKKSGFQTKKEALAYIPTLLAGGVTKSKVAPRLSEYWKLYDENHLSKIGKSKQVAYRIAWKKLSGIQDVRVDALSVEVLQETVTTAASTFYTQKDCRTVLKALFRMAGADGFVNADLPSLIEIENLDEKEQIPFNESEQKALWHAYESGNRDACIPLLMIYTGMMPGEAQLLKVEHIDIEKRTMFGMNLKTKTRKKTPVVIADCLLPVLEDLIANAMPSGYIWARNETRWYERYYDALEKSGCRKLPPYSCRHTTATALAIDKSIAPQTVKRVMRWSSTRLMDRYVHPGQEDALSAVNSMTAAPPATPGKSAQKDAKNQ